MKCIYTVTRDASCKIWEWYTDEVEEEEEFEEESEEESESEESEESEDDDADVSKNKEARRQERRLARREIRKEARKAERAEQWRKKLRGENTSAGSRAAGLGAKVSDKKLVMGEGWGDSKPAIPASARWRIKEKHYFDQDHARVHCVALHRKTDLLVVGFSSGVFGVYQMPEITNIHTLSISQQQINTVAINASSDWLAFGSAR
jgi:hypothetical protein